MVSTTLFIEIDQHCGPLVYSCETRWASILLIKITCKGVVLKYTFRIVSYFQKPNVAPLIINLTTLITYG